MSAPAALLWFRQDLRLADNAALAAAIASEATIIPIFILDDEAEGSWVAGGASRWWLHHSLLALDATLRAAGTRLIVRRGRSSEQLVALLAETEAKAVYWNRRYEPIVSERDRKIEIQLCAQGFGVETFNSSLLFEPQEIKNRQGGPFQVFSAFWRFLMAQPLPAPIKVKTAKITAPARWPQSLEIEDLTLLPTIPWDTGLVKTWVPGEAGAQRHWLNFRKRISAYFTARDYPAEDATSRLSPHLHFGEIGPRQVWAAVKELSRQSGIFPADSGAQKFLAEMAWREFAYHLLHHFPKTPANPLRATFDHFPWARDPGEKRLKAWQRGRTGYPIVDAGMRELWATGWMPNRVRMITSSFLVKHLLQPWQAGAAWFWDTLVDADLANNTLGWQWIAGSGADASPFFRIFSPVLQGQKFDPKGEYVKRWVPELEKLPVKYLQAPWTAPAEVLERAGVRLGVEYPKPIVDHETARDAALDAYRSLRGK